MKNIFKIATASAVAVVSMAFVAPAANADTQTVTIRASVSGSAIASGHVTASASGASSAFSAAAAQVRSRAATTKRCIWSPGWQSYVSGGKVIWHYDSVPMHLCKLRHPVRTGGRKATYKKIGGGSSGLNCGNPAIPSHVQPANNSGAILDVRSGTTASVGVSANASVDVAVGVEVYLTYMYNGKTFTVGSHANAAGHGESSASGVARVRVTNRTKLSTTAAAISAVKESVRSKAATSANANAQADARAKAEASVDVMITINVETGSPTMSLTLYKPNDLDQSIAHPGGTTEWSFTKTMGHAVAPDGAGDVTYSVEAKYGFVKFVTANSPCETTGLHDNVVTTMTQPSGTYDLTMCYIASTEDPASYGGTDTITLKSTFAGQTYSDAQSITVNPTPQPPL